MPTHTYIVEVETERDSGLFASRDDISEKIEEAIADAEDNIDLSGLGPRGDSEYSVQSFSVDAVDLNTKAGRDTIMEYDALVVADLPGDAKLRAENKRLRSQLKELNKVLNEVKDRNIKYQEALEKKQSEERTRIWYSDSMERRSGAKSFIPDGQYDRVFFQYGERDDQNLSVELDADGQLTLMNHGWAQLMVFPVSGNHIKVRMEER